MHSVCRRAEEGLFKWVSDADDNWYRLIHEHHAFIALIDFLASRQVQTIHDLRKRASVCFENWDNSEFKGFFQFTHTCPSFDLDPPSLSMLSLLLNDISNSFIH